MSTAVLVILVAIVGAVLFLPISLRANGAAGEEELWGVAEVRWGHAVVMFRLSSEHGARIYILGVPIFRIPRSWWVKAWQSKTKGQKTKKRRHRRAQGKTKNRPSLMELLGERRQAVMRMLTQGLSALHPHVYLGGTVGLGDPMHTAALITAAQNLSPLLPERVELDVRDDYLQDTTQLFARMSALVVPAELVLIALGWLVRTDTRRTLLGT